MAMAANPLQKQPARGEGKRFEKGRSGNPAGRRPGSRNAATRAAEALLDGEAAALTRKAVEMALGGDPAAMRLCLERVLAPRRERTVEFALPEIRGAADLGAAMAAITTAAAQGVISPGEAAGLAQIVDTFVRAIDAADFERRLRLLEEDRATRA
jgi:Family of unknown function (DUF5681)